LPLDGFSDAGLACECSLDAGNEELRGVFFVAASSASGFATRDLFASICPSKNSTNARTRGVNSATSSGGLVNGTRSPLMAGTWAHPGKLEKSNFKPLRCERLLVAVLIRTLLVIHMWA
jgi:hypothetical protein